MKQFPEELFRRYSALESCRADIEALLNAMIDLYRADGTLFLCGNGGSAADCDHIAGELLKGFRRLRPLSGAEKSAFEKAAPGEGAPMAEKLQQGFRAVSLLSHPGFVSAFCNDVDASLIFAQQLCALGRPGDLLLAISTGGNAVNVRNAMIAAHAHGMRTALLTGEKHGKCEAFADFCVRVPERETYRIQELHLPIYHALCAGVEEEFFDR